MDATPYRGLPDPDVICPFLRQYTSGNRDSVCRAALRPLTITPGYAVACCHARSHVACRRYIAVRGRDAADALLGWSGQGPLVLEPEAVSPPHDTPEQADRRGRLGAVAAVLGSLMLMLVIAELQLDLPRPAAGAGPEPSPHAVATLAGTLEPPTADDPAAALEALAVPAATESTSLGVAVVETSPAPHGINLYRAPERGSFVLRAIKPGERLTLLEGPRETDGETWWKVEYVGRSGWVLASAIKRLP